MTRNNPRIVDLEREVSLLRNVINNMRNDPGDVPVTGCGDNSCIVARPKGQATNGGCRCEARELRYALIYYKRRSIFLEETIKEIRDHQNDIK
jgi:hypothetical protein